MIKILFIEDNKEFAESCIAELLKNNYIVEYADNAEKAKQIFLEKEIDILIIDLMLPPTFLLEGLNFYRFAKEHRDTPAIFMSSKSFKTTDIVAEAMKLGAKDFLDKDNSVFKDRLITVIKEILMKKNKSNKLGINSSFAIILVYLLLFVLLLGVLTLLTYLITKIGLPFLQTFLVITTVTISVLVIIISSQLLNDAKITEDTWLKVLKSRIVNFPNQILEKIFK